MHLQPIFVVVAENIAGVKPVRDHLVYIDPTSDMVFYPPDEKRAKSA